MNYLSPAIQLLAVICQLLSVAFGGFGVYYLKKHQLTPVEKHDQVIKNLSSSTGAFMFAWLFLNISLILFNILARLN